MLQCFTQGAGISESSLFCLSNGADRCILIFKRVHGGGGIILGVKMDYDSEILRLR